MIQVRHNMFETNSSSSSVIIYRRDLEIPRIVELFTKDYKRDQVNGYYSFLTEEEGVQFMAWLRKIGVEHIYLDGQLVEDDTPCTTSFKLINSVCESHNEDIDDEEILKYNLFGKVVERAAEDYETEAEVLKKYKNKPGYVWSEWFG